MNYFYEIPCLPIRQEGDVSVYSTSQIDMFGFPDTWGVFNYYVITTLDHERPLKMDWNYQQYIRGSSRPIHRYDRVKRFESTLFQLLGLRGHVDIEVVKDLKNVGYDHNPLKIWESIRAFLKSRKLRKYYNRIPTIIQMLQYPFKIIPPSNSKLLWMVNEFRKMNTRFSELKHSRKYFINIRYIVLKMLEQHNVVIEYYIPFVRTKRKQKPLDNIWNKIH